MNTSFKMFYPSLGSSYSPNLSVSSRIARFENSLPEVTEVTEITYGTPHNNEAEILYEQLIAVLNSDFTYNFATKLTKNEILSTSDVLVLTLQTQFCNKIENIAITISTITQLYPDITPYYIFNNTNQTVDFYLSSVYDSNNISLNANISMKDGSTHIYNASYYGLAKCNTPVGVTLVTVNTPS